MENENDLNKQSEVLTSEEKLKLCLDNSIEVAISLGADPNILAQIKNETKINEVYGRPKYIWYGECFYSERVINVYRDNFASLSIPQMAQEMSEIGINPNLIQEAAEMDSSKFRQIFNQSGMDHELIGHMYNFITGQPNDELAAVKVQIEMAKSRSIENKDWEIIADMMPEILKKHKNIDTVN